MDYTVHLFYYAHRIILLLDWLIDLNLWNFLIMKSYSQHYDNPLF